MIQQLQDVVQGYLPNVLAAVVILLVGWLLALLVGSFVRGAVNRVVSRRAPAEAAAETNLEPPRVGKWAGRIVFYTALTFVIAGAFQALQLDSVSGPLDTMLERLTAYLPQLAGGALLLVIGLAAANGLRFAARKGLELSDVGERIADRAGLADGRPVARTVGDIVFWATLLVFLPAVLDVLELDGLVAPLQTMFAELLGVLPDLAGAVLILLLGRLLASVLRRAVSGILASAGADRLGERVGMGPEAGPRRLSSVVGLLVYALVLIPTAIAALDALRIDSVSAPATRMLEQVLAAVPLLFAAAVLITLAVLVGRVLAGLVTGVLKGVGFDGLFERLGLEVGQAGRGPSELAGRILFVALLLVAGIEAAELLGFNALALLAQDFFAFGARLLLSLAILGIGLYLGRLAYDVMPRGEGFATVYATAARVAIIVLAATMALQNTGVANEIVTLTFGLVLGAAAVAAAIAFGLGSRDVARRIVEGAVASEPDAPSHH